MDTGQGEDEARRLRYQEPRFPLGRLVDATGIPEVTLRNWLTRGRLALDADQVRVGRSHRLFSERDAVLIGLLHSLGMLGLTITEAAPIANDVMRLLNHMVVAVPPVPGKPQVLIWKTAHGWRVAGGGDADDERLPPPATITLRLNDLLELVLGRLDAPVSGGAAA